MTSTTPAPPRDSWLAVDDNFSASEVLAVLGVLVWGGALVWMVVSDILKARSTADGHRAAHAQQWQGEASGRSQERPR